MNKEQLKKIEEIKGVTKCGKCKVKTMHDKKTGKCEECK